MVQENAPRQAGSQGKAAGGHERAGGQGRTEVKAKAEVEGQNQKPSKEQIAQQKREKKLEAKREQVRKAAKGAEISYKEAAAAIGIISNIQDEHEQVIHPDTVGQLHKLAEKYGKVTPEEELKAEELVAISQEILRAAQKIKVEDGDLEYTKGKNKTLEKKGKQSVVDKVQNPDEETVTLEKISQYTSVEEFGQIAEEGGPGAAKAEAVEQHSFGQLIRERLYIYIANKRRVPTDNVVWDRNTKQLEQIVKSSNPDLVASAFRNWNKLLNSILLNPGPDDATHDDLHAVFPPGMEDELKVKKDANDVRFKASLLDLPNKGESLIGDIDDVADRLLSSMRWGTVDPDQWETMLLNVALQHSERELPGLEGIRLWYAHEKFELLLISKEIVKRSEVKADAMENVKSVYDTMIFFDKSGVLENFSLARQRLTLLQESIEASPDERLTPDIKKRIERHIEAFERITPLYIINKQKEGDPGSLAGPVEAVEDDSFFYMFDRWNRERVIDKNGLSYFVDRDGNEIDVNLLSETANAFIYQYMVDRFRVNFMQELTLRNLDVGTTNKDERWVIQRMNELRIDLAKWGGEKGNGVKTRILWDWYKEETLMGVDGFDETTGKERKVTKEDEVMNVDLRKRLKDKHVDPDRINDLLGNYEIVQAVKNSALNYVKYFVASGLDRFRIYDQQKSTSSNKVVVASVFGEETPFFSREADYVLDFYLQEKHGDARVVDLMRQKADEDWYGFFYPSNIILGRVLSEGGYCNISDGGKAAPGFIDRHRGMVVDGVPSKSIEGLKHKVESPEWKAGDKDAMEINANMLMSIVLNGWNPDENANHDDQMDIFNIEWDKASKVIDHYMMVDNTNDRKSAIEWYNGDLKQFTFQPFEEETVKALKTHYSSRLVRKGPGAEFLIDIVWEAGQHWPDWFSYRDKISNAQLESIGQRLKEANVIQAKRADEIINKKIGGPIPRTMRQTREFLIASLKSIARPGFLIETFWDFFKALFKYLTSGR